MIDLAHLLHPVSVATFLDSHWEKQPLVVTRGRPDHYGDLFTLADVDTLLGFSRWLPFEVRLSKVGEPARPYMHERGAPHPDGTPDLNRIYVAFAQGYTLNVQNLDRRWPPLAGLCARLEETLQHQTGTTIYLTPARSQAAPVHYDGDDVLIVQLHGSKRWRLYGPYADLPLPDFGHLPEGDPGPPTREFVLEQGDLLYMPRGEMHEALTGDDTSLHLTIGIRIFSWLDFIQAALDAWAARDARLRAPLPIGWLHDGIDTETVRALLVDAASGLRAAEGRARLLDELQASRGAPPGGRFL